MEGREGRSLAVANVRCQKQAVQRNVCTRDENQGPSHIRESTWGKKKPPTTFPDLFFFFFFLFSEDWNLGCLPWLAIGDGKVRGFFSLRYFTRSCKSIPDWDGCVGV